ncbi:MAG: thioredoxin domain-containing protein [Candidatus Roizmanbacteria bacterium]
MPTLNTKKITKSPTISHKMEPIVLGPENISPELLQMLDDRYAKGSPSKLLVILLVAVSFFAGYLFLRTPGGNIQGLNIFAGSQTVQPTKSAVQQASPLDNVNTYAKELGLNEGEFKKCLDSGKTAEYIKSQQSEGTSAGIQATPSMVIYDTQTGSGILVEGAYPYDQLKIALSNFKQGIAQKEYKSITVAKPNFDTERWLGNKDARYAWIEYNDLECPYCKKAHPDVKRITSENSSDMVWMIRHFPLPFHASAQKLAESAECAGAQKGNTAFFAMMDKIFQ